ncbi:hypothetical protein GGTG_11477 [Gaeumannomyces tritici R3-111a-1]|uniref:Uncharacterized protein n=1 Tax=Gaeumannomyces tritici (strain R3-111a-1) TaxID=644352 RepID=J3PDA9_GAET3|nr:hypothetical protein GGTG_11477 [Gaeumannomyces tritici R3-111a-1]EJT70454.1 hypothetical protein GGTG_11477 [Gaeumannomyces tritici R3-111a-1]
MRLHRARLHQSLSRQLESPSDWERFSQAWPAPTHPFARIVRTHDDHRALQPIHRPADNGRGMTRPGGLERGEGRGCCTTVVDGRARMSRGPSRSAGTGWGLGGRGLAGSPCRSKAIPPSWSRCGGLSHSVNLAPESLPLSGFCPQICPPGRPSPSTWSVARYGGRGGQEALDPEPPHPVQGIIDGQRTLFVGWSFS